MHLAWLFLFLLPPSRPAASNPAHAHVAEIVVPKACVQRIECKGEWHLKNKMWSCPSLTVAFSCYRPKVEPSFSGPAND